VVEKVARQAKKICEGGQSAIQLGDWRLEIGDFGWDFVSEGGWTTNEQGA
jgi:hypothetical protein